MWRLPFGFVSVRIGRPGVLRSPHDRQSGVWVTSGSCLLKPITHVVTPREVDRQVGGWVVAGGNARRLVLFPLDIGLVFPPLDIGLPFLLHLPLLFRCSHPPPFGAEHSCRVLRHGQQGCPPHTPQGLNTSRATTHDVRLPVLPRTVINCSPLIHKDPLPVGKAPFERPDVTKRGLGVLVRFLHAIWVPARRLVNGMLGVRLCNVVNEKTGNRMVFVPVCAHLQLPVILFRPLRIHLVGFLRAAVEVRV